MELGYISYFDFCQYRLNSAISVFYGVACLVSNRKVLHLFTFVQADVPKLKDAICSAVDVMQAMSSSICSLLPKVNFAFFLFIFSPLLPPQPPFIFSFYVQNFRLLCPYFMEKVFLFL